MYYEGISVQIFLFRGMGIIVGIPSLIFLIYYNADMPLGGGVKRQIGRKEIMLV